MLLGLLGAKIYNCHCVFFSKTDEWCPKQTLVQKWHDITTHQDHHLQSYKTMEGKKKKTQQCLRSTKWIFHRQKFLPPAFPLVWCTHEVQLLLYTFRMDGKHGSQDHLALLMDHRRVQVLPVLTVILGGSACGPEERQQQGQDMEHQHPDLYSAQTVHPCDDMITTELYRCRLMKRLSGGKKRVTNTSKATHE